MIVTEAEAAKLLCCGPTGCGVTTTGGERVCAGSRCMAWVINHTHRASPAGQRQGACGLAEGE